MTRDQQEEIRRLRASGEGYKRIAAMLGLSVNTVKSFCQRDNVKQETGRPDDTTAKSCVYTSRENAKQAALRPINTDHCHTSLPQGNVTGKAVCLRCGKPVAQIPGRRKRFFCSDACRMGYWRNLARPVGGIRRCAGCGKVLLGHDRTRKYCRHACYIAHRFGTAQKEAKDHL